MSEKRYRTAGYVKLAKLWERAREEAISYHNEYYRKKFLSDPQMELVGVYIDITGQKHIRKREQMIYLLKECMKGSVDCIATQTRAYLAADNEEFFFLLHFLFTLTPPIQIVTEDDNYHIDTIRNADGQTEALKTMAADYVKMNQKEYKTWRDGILKEAGVSNE